VLTGFVPNDSGTVNAVDAVAAIQQVAPEAVAGSAGTTEGTDSETAAAVETQAGSVTAPTDAADGIQIAGGDASALTIGLPFAQKASDATESQVPGVVVYDNNNGSSTVPVIRDGGVQISTVIDNANAPKRYDYPMDLPAGHRLYLNGDGSAIAAGEDGAVSAFVAPPWAKDANGNAVPTHYEVNGNTLTQVIDFTSATAFPVVADPSVSSLWWGIAIKLTRNETKELARNFTPAYFSNLVCRAAGPFQGPCLLGVNIRLWTWQKPVLDAAAQGRCAQFNMPWGTGVAVWNMTNERC
jgi:hypothetical protein